MTKSILDKEIIKAQKQYSKLVSQIRQLATRIKTLCDKRYGDKHEIKKNQKK